MKTRTLTSMILAAAMLLSLAACSGGQSAATKPPETAAPGTAAPDTPSTAAPSAGGDYEYPEVTWKVAHACQDGSPSDIGCKAFADYIMEASGGKITVEVYPAGQLGTDIAELESCQLGDLEFTSGSTFALQQVSSIDGCLMWDLPYFFTPFSVLDNDKIALMKDDPSYQNIFVDQLQEKNIHYINQSAHGNYVIFGNKPFRTVDDFKNVKLRAAENAMLVETLQEWGAQPVVINMFELFTALQQGACDAAYVPDALAYQFGLQDACKYVTYFEGGLGPCYLSCAESFYQQWDPEVQQLITEAGEKYWEASSAAYNEQCQQFIDAFEAGDCEVVWLTQEEKDALREAASGTHAHWRDLCGADLYDASQAYIAEVLQ